MPYVLIGIAGFLFICIIYQRIHQQQSDLMTASDKANLKLIHQNLESCMEDMDRIATEIFTDHKIMILANMENKAQNEKNYYKAIAKKELKDIKYFNYLIQETDIYFDKEQIILTPKSIRTFDMLKDDFEITDEQFENMLTAEYLEGKLLALSGKLFYVRSTRHWGEDLVNVITKLDTDNLKKNIFGHGIAQEEVKISRVDDQVEILIGAQNMEDYYETTLFEEESGLIYRHRTSKILLHEKLLLTVLAAVGILIGFLLLLYFGLRSVTNNYKEIQKLMNMLSRHYKQQSNEEPYSELDYMKNALSYLEGIIRKQGIIVTDDAVKKAIYGLMIQDDDIYTWLTSEKELFAEGVCALALINRNVEDKGEDQKPGLNYFIINNIIRELFEAFQFCSVIVTYQYYIVILNWKLERFDMEWIRDQFEQFYNFMDKNYNLSYNIALSTPKEHILLLSEAYEEGLVAMEERRESKESPIFYYEPSAERNKKHSFDAIMQDKLINLVKSGDHKGARDILQEIFEYNYIEHRISSEWEKILFIDLSQVFFKLSEELGTVIEIPMEELFSQSYIPEKFMDKLMHASDLLCQFGLKGAIDRNDKIQRIQQVIAEEYQNPDLSVAMLADRFSMSASYLSRAFKEHTGETLLNYIMVCRMEHAKYYLQQSDESISAIGEMTGFTNAVTFNRVFKKFQGITPGKYREINR